MIEVVEKKSKRKLILFLTAIVALFFTSGCLLAYYLPYIEAWFFRTIIEDQSKEFLALSRIINKNPSNIKALKRRAELALKVFGGIFAIDAYTDILAVNPDDYDILRERAFCY